MVCQFEAMVCQFGKKKQDINILDSTSNSYRTAEALMTVRASLLATVTGVVTLAFLILDPTLEGQEAKALLNPAALTEQALAKFNVKVDTSVGEFVVEVQRDWAPLGADRFYNLVKNGFFDGQRFFRVTENFAQFGIHGQPEVAKAWLRARIPDEDLGRPKQSNRRGTLSFLQAGGRRTQMFINLTDNPVMDEQCAPFGMVSSGMNVVARLYAGYGEPAPTGKGPLMTPMLEHGNSYLEKEFPRLDYIKTARVVP